MVTFRFISLSRSEDQSRIRLGSRTEDRVRFVTHTGSFRDSVGYIPFVGLQAVGRMGRVACESVALKLAVRGGRLEATSHEAMP